MPFLLIFHTAITEPGVVLVGTSSSFILSSLSSIVVTLALCSHSFVHPVNKLTLNPSITHQKSRIIVIAEMSSSIKIAYTLNPPTLYHRIDHWQWCSETKSHKFTFMLGSSGGTVVHWIRFEMRLAMSVRDTFPFLYVFPFLYIHILIRLTPPI